MSALRLTRQDAPTVALSTVASLSLAAIFWVAAHHPAAAVPPQTLLPPPAHSHQAQTLPAVVHHGESLHPNPNPGVVVLSDQHPTTGTSSTAPSPTPSPSPERPPATVLSVTTAPCARVLVVRACLPSIGVTP